ncbi:MAG TPA: hypothetical protein DDE71_04805, partial [Tenacibaculum sp.]|nr:hypothetical protein [Tenacibaculum sp.]
KKKKKFIELKKKETAEIGYLLMQLQIPPGDALHIALFQRSHTEKHSEKIYQKTCSISNLTLAPLKKKHAFFKHLFFMNYYLTKKFSPRKILKIQTNVEKRSSNLKIIRNLLHS